jgi:hypothetical protein
MTRVKLSALCLLLVFALLRSVQPSAQSFSDLAGAWTLNRQLSQFPSELGFSADFLGALGPGAGPVSAGRGGGRGGGRRNVGGGGSGGGLGAPKIVRETEEDTQRALLLTDEVRNPFEHLTITETPTDVTITPDRAAARTFHPNGKDEEIAVGRVMATVNARWDGSRLIIVYKVETGRELHYTYSLNANPTQLIVDVEFVERGGGDKVRRIYAPATAADTRAAAAPVPPVAAASPALAPASAPTAPATASIDQRPDAALKGLMKLGVVVEDLSSDAAACSLTRDEIGAAVSKHLADAGLRVVRNADDDTYMYVDINTAKLSTGVCVSRYDVTLYSHAAAPLSYTASPVLLQVELLHKGGIAGGAPAAHAERVMENVLEYVDQFSARIRNAAK